MKKQALLALLVGGFLSAYAKDWNFAGPDGRVQVTVSDEGGRPSYSVKYDGVTFLEPSPLGLVTNIGDYSQGVSLGEEMKLGRVDETYSLATIKQSTVHYEATEAVCPIIQGGERVYDIVFRVSNRDVAFKYKVYPKGNTLCCVVKEEKTGFVLPEGSTTFLCPQAKPMGGFARTSPSYETSYTTDDEMGKNGWGEGYTFPCLFKNGTKGWTLVSETGVDSRYCASRLIGHEGGLYTVGYPQEGEYNGNGTTAPGIVLPGETPWRTVTVGTTLAPIVETTVAFDLVAPLYEASQKYQYGCGTWSWIIGGDASMTYDEQKRYIDFAADMGYGSVLVE